MMHIPLITFVKRHGSISLEYTLNGLKNCCAFKHQIKEESQKGISIFVGVPDNSPRNKKEYRIHYLFFESTRLPQHWVTILNNTANEIWTSQSWLKLMFQESGLKKEIYIVPLGTDPPVPAFTKIKKNFFQFTILGGFIDRKAILETCEVFVNTFKHTNTILRIHCTHGISSLYEKVKQFSSPQIHITYKNLSKIELINLWANTDCILSPSKGEAWGYPPREALYYNIPSIVTDIPAYDDLEDYRVIKVKIKEKRKAIYNALGDCECGENWIFDANDLSEKMKWIINNKLQPGIIHKNLLWQDVKQSINSQYLRTIKTWKQLINY